MLNEEPAQSQDLQMMGMLLPLGIEKGKDFKPDVATVARLNSAAAEAHAWLLAQIPTFVTDWWPGRRQAAGEFADRRVLPFHAVPTCVSCSFRNGAKPRWMETKTCQTTSKAQGSTGAARSNV